MREINETSSVADDYAANLMLSLNYIISSKFRFSGLVSYSFININRIILMELILMLLLRINLVSWTIGIAEGLTGQ